MRYDAVVFDNDGVLVEPTDWDVIRRAIREAFGEVGVENPADEHVERLIGVEVEDVHAVADAYDLDPETLWHARDTAGARHQSALIRDGGKSLFEDVEAIGRLDAARGLVSNNQHATIETILEEYDLKALFDVAYGRQPTVTDIGRKKPDPYYLNAALRELGAESAMYVGDTEKDVEVAHRVGADAALVRRSHNADLRVGPTPEYEVGDLRDLVERL